MVSPFSGEHEEDRIQIEIDLNWFFFFFPSSGFHFRDFILDIACSLCCNSHPTKGLTFMAMNAKKETHT